MAREIIADVLGGIEVAARALSSAPVPTWTHGLRPGSRRFGALDAVLIGSTWKGPSLTRRHQSSQAKVNMAMPDASTRCAILAGSRSQGHRFTVPVHFRWALGLSKILGPP